MKQTKTYTKLQLTILVVLRFLNGWHLLYEGIAKLLNPQWSSASERYYASRGLTTTTINGRQVDVTHSPLREWLRFIRNGETSSANIDMAFEEGITCIMAQKSYLEKRAVVWDVINRKII